MATLTKSTGTVTLSGAVEKVTLPAVYGWVWVKNMSDSVIFAGLSADISEGADGVMRIPAGECGRVQTDGFSSIYLLGSGNALVVAQNYADCPFKVGGKGGDSPDLSLYAKKSDIQNENLLMNPDFKINQRGVTNIGTPSGTTSFVYTVDRWALDNGGNVTVNSDGTLTVKGTMSQILENAVGTNVTASIGIISGTATANYDNSAKKFSITGDNAVISWAKLEYGNIATPFISPDPATELMKCQRYCIVLPPTRYNRASFVGATTLIFPISLPTSMRCVPSIENGEAYILDITKPYDTQVDKSYSITISPSSHSSIINFVAKNASATASIDSCLYVTKKLVLSADL